MAGEEEAEQMMETGYGYPAEAEYAETYAEEEPVYEDEYGTGPEGDPYGYWDAAYCQARDGGSGIADVKYVDKITTPEGGLAYGHIDYTKFPFRVRIAKDTPRGRQLVTLVHEMVHAISRLRKLNLNEQQVHALAIGIIGDIIPVLEKQKVLERKHG
jgi:hypothetical protein